MIPINTIGRKHFGHGWEPSPGNIHVSKDVSDKYPQMIFKGKPFPIKGRDMEEFIRATYMDGSIQMEIGECFYYSFCDDFFWFASDFK
jgi:hypothetical protein